VPKEHKQGSMNKTTIKNNWSLEKRILFRRKVKVVKTANDTIARNHGVAIKYEDSSPLSKRPLCKDL
jgi:hypothetical protein